MKAKVLVIDDEKGIRLTFSDFLTDDGYEVSTAVSYGEALSMMEDSLFDIILIDIILGSDSGIDLLKEIKERRLNCPVIMITGYPDIKTASESVRLGAFDYISKPVEKEELLHIAGRALQYKIALDEKEKYKTNLEAIFNSVDDAIITIDRGHSITEINSATERVCGHVKEHITGKNINELLMECGMGCMDAALESIEKRKPSELNYIECGGAKGSGKVVNAKASPLIDCCGNFSGAVLIIRDMTRLVEMERDLGRRKRFFGIIGKSEGMHRIYKLIEDLAEVQSTVLITGESGTGKELVADALHFRSNRKEGPFIKVNCTALSESILESELFGHVKGAFTGAYENKKGRFEVANHGTLFLDEIGDISPKMQMKILRVIQEKELERVGDSTPLKVDVRIVAATNQDLSEKKREGAFREDLYYRLNVVDIKLPPLRNRREDIPLLTEHFIKKFNKEFGKEIKALSEDVMKLFMNYSWPGNVRELEHALEHAFILCHHSVITVVDLPVGFLTQEEETKEYEKSSHDLENPETIINALRQAEWKKAKAARLLGVNRKTVYRKMRKFDIKPKSDN